jgi:hypothetical protein
MKRLFLLLSSLLVIAASGVAHADETNFPSRYRTLETMAPAHCGDWVAPLPLRRVKVTLPKSASREVGSAQLTITINPDGSYGGLVEALTNEEVFVRAATDSLQDWSFTPARCNGVAVAVQAKVFFNFRHESFVSFASGTYLQ